MKVNADDAVEEINRLRGGGAGAIVDDLRLASATERMTEPFGLSIVSHPAKLPVVAISAFWHAKFHHSPANRWLRNLVFDVFGDERA